MEHNLGDTLNLESTMGNMDFDQSSVVINETDISLEPGAHEGDIPMEFENIEEEQMLMETGNEEVIVSDFMGDQFTLQEYCIQQQEAQLQETETVVQTNQLNMLTSQAETMINFQYEPDNISILKQDDQQQPKYITVRAANTTVKNIAPKQVMIAPKPPNFPSSGAQKSILTKQYAIAPKPATKPVQLVKNSVMKVALSNFTQGTNKPVFTQLGGKLLMMPTRAPQKFKLLPTNAGAVHYVKTGDQQAQLIATKVAQTNKLTKPILTKVAVQGQANMDPSNQPAVLTKLVPVTTTTGAPQARYVMHPKTVPISLAGNKVILTSPTKQSNLKFTKKQQLVTVKSPTPKLLPAPAQVTTTKKVVISTNPNQNVILKTTAPTKPVISKESSLLVTQNQRTQLHQISVPGKGIQYIRLVTNNPPAKPRSAPQANTFMLADAKGNLIPMTAEKMGNNQSPLLVITGNMAGPNKGSSKSPKKLVRLAPVGSKTSQNTQQIQSSQSLLAPMSPTPETQQFDALSINTSNAEEQTIDIKHNRRLSDEEKQMEHIEHLKENSGFRSLSDHNPEIHHLGEEYSISEVTVDFERRESPTEHMNLSEDNDKEDMKPNNHPVIVIPSNCLKQMEQEKSKKKTLVFIENESEDTPSLEKTTSSVEGNMLNVETEIVPYDMSPSPPPVLSDTEMARTNDLGCPRKACNCTKSQCLKMYCDCFANGKFCNNCNCNNCHNNIENEVLRQKAIRACLERNPNAFRPKIGKAKSAGPEPVRRHTKGCNCKRSGCLKNYCECFEAKIECTAMCKCVGCRNVEEAVGKRMAMGGLDADGHYDPMYRPPPNNNNSVFKLPSSFMTWDVIVAVNQCLLASAVESAEQRPAPAAQPDEPDGIGDALAELGRCLQDIISASNYAPPLVADQVTQTAIVDNLL
ncbi:hypothetical protein K1T71_009638 [Dendrolimus kikuchii]|uniref:Uncharacterized protein n=1 Tax=Dendrolimus kikuchii TaxID=765133 RepID=A0ACC1CSY5_9NEOP|nr:hypothetical protein K1T71_009638 [Dendrolimus kikuchii]